MEGIVLNMESRLGPGQLMALVALALMMRDRVAARGWLSWHRPSGRAAFPFACLRMYLGRNVIRCSEP